MAQFEYLALDSAGRQVRGQLDAVERTAAASALRQQDLFVVEIKSAAEGTGVVESAARTSGGWSLVRYLPITSQDRVLFLRQLALMINTGLTLLQALEVCSGQSRKRALSRAIDQVRESIQRGNRFSEALAAEKRLFPDVVVNLVRSAEASGELDTTLERAAQLLDAKADLQQKVLTSLTYPAIVIAVSIGVAAFLVLSIIPKFADFIARRGGQLPWATRLLMDVASFIQSYGLYLLAILGAVLIALVATYITRAGRLLLHRALLYIPVIGGVFSIGAMTSFSRTMATLLESGLTLLESLTLAKQVVGNRAIALSVETAADQVLRGRQLAGSLRSAVIPPMVIQVIAVGERTGTLSQVLGELGDYYDRMLQLRIRRMSTLIEPVMILIVGGMVGFVYFAFFQAVMQLATAG